MNIFWHNTVSKKRFFIPQYGTSLWYDAIKQVKEKSNDAKCVSDDLRKIKSYGGYVTLYEPDYSRVKPKPLENKMKKLFQMFEESKSKFNLSYKEKEM